MSDVISLPDGTQHTISAAEWNIARDLQNGWQEKIRQSHSDAVLPDTLPLYTKFSRSTESDGKHSITITLPAEQENTPPKTFDILVDKPLTHSFIIGPHSKEKPNTPVLGALQHESTPKKNNEKKPYIYYRNGQTEQKKTAANVRVKWFIPDSNIQGATPCLYKSHRCSTDDTIQKLNIGIRRGESKKVASNKIASFMEYTGGPNLKHYFSKNRSSRSDTIKIIRQCCEEVQKLHMGQLEKSGKKCLHNDIKLENFTYNKKNVRLIDENDVAAMDEKGQAITRIFSVIEREIIDDKKKGEIKNSYTPPPVIKDIQNNGSSTVSIRSDIYALGKVTNGVAESSSSADQEILSLIGDLMSVAENETHPPLNVVIHWLACESLITSMTDYLGTSTPADHVVEQKAIDFNASKNEKDNEKEQKKDHIRKILHAFYINITTPQTVSYFQLEALAFLFKHFPAIIENSKEPWRILFDQEKGPVLACAVLGAAEYLKFNENNTMSHSDDGRIAATGLINTLFNNPTVETKDTASFSKSIATIVTHATQGDGVTKRSSGKRKHSRKTIFDKYTDVANTMPSYESIHSTHLEQKKPSLTLEQQKAIVQLNRFFPKEHQKTSNIIENPLLACVILKSMEYLEKSDTAGWYGKRSVKILVKTLLDKQINDIQKEVQDCYQASSSRYKLFGLLGHASSGKENSREQILNEALKTAPHPE